MTHDDIELARSAADAVGWVQADTGIVPPECRPERIRSPLLRGLLVDLVSPVQFVCLAAELRAEMGRRGHDMVVGQGLVWIPPEEVGQYDYGDPLDEARAVMRAVVEVLG